MDFSSLNQWFLDHQRDLIFRKTKEPYHIWVSEIMLQQTQVDTVLPYFVKFVEKYPTINDLARSSLDDLLHTVEGIGYYRRFKMMHQAALLVANDYHGIFPNTYEEVLRLPGVGLYTAGAIMSIAYDQPYSAVDGNVIRVLSRYFMIDDDFRLDKNKKKLNELNQKIIRKTIPSVYTQALMELGATLCKPKNPECLSCPLVKTCKAYEHKKTILYPKLSPLKEKKVIEFITLILKKDDQIVLKKQTEALLEGLYLYPQYASDSINYVIDNLQALDIIIEPIEDLGIYTHMFTHQKWIMHVYVARLIKGTCDQWIFLDADKKNHKPMPIAHKKINI